MKKLYLSAACALLFGAQASAQGIDIEKSVPLFDINFVEAFGIADISPVHPTLALCGQNIVVNPGDGSTPVYVDPATGKKMGEIAIGDAVATGAIASDDKGNMLIGNYCEAHKDLTLYKTSSVTATPEVFISWNNDHSLPLGNRLHIQGDLDGTAVIIAACEGVPGVTGTKTFFRWNVKDGKPDEPEKCEFTDASMEYWINGANNAKIVTKSTDKADGYFTGYYKADKFFHVNGDATKVEQYLIGPGGNYDANSCDSRFFNGDSYTVLMDQSHFPQWGLNGNVYLYNTTVVNADTFSGTINNTVALLSAFPMADYSEKGTKSGMCTGDILIAKTDNMMGVYYITSTYLNFGGVMYPAASSGLNEININNIPVEFFNLHGIRVEKPANGIFIRRQGEKVTKILVK